MSTILIVGVGALGCRIAVLAKAKGWDVILQDYDIVQSRNLGRQPLYTEDDVGRKKVEVAKTRLEDVETRDTPFDVSSDVRVDCIIDGTDNLRTRLVMNDLARKHNVPLIIGAASKDRGMVFTVSDACWQCVVRGKHATDSCDDGIENDVLDRVAGEQVRMAEKMFAGSPERGLVRCTKDGERTIDVRKNPACAACGGTYEYLEKPSEFDVCVSSGRIIARTKAIDLARLQAEKDYGDAVLVHLGSGIALVHRHGLVEFERVDEQTAREFLERECEAPGGASRMH